jgi:hypothetical protein|nr:MAG TPA: hypothetical protein [Caudoviricetes sp.]
MKQTDEITIAMINAARDITIAKINAKGFKFDSYVNHVNWFERSLRDVKEGVEKHLALKSD